MLSSGTCRSRETNPNVDDLRLRDVPFALESGIVFSRQYRNGCVNFPADDSVIHLGDVIRLDLLEMFSDVPRHLQISELQRSRR